jgi:hypothetical protein
VMMEAMRSSETSILTRATRRHIPEDVQVYSMLSVNDNRQERRPMAWSVQTWTSIQRSFSGDERSTLVVGPQIDISDQFTMTVLMQRWYGDYRQRRDLLHCPFVQHLQLSYLSCSTATHMRHSGAVASETSEAPSSSCVDTFPFHRFSR